MSCTRIWEVEKCEKCAGTNVEDTNHVDNRRFNYLSFDLWSISEMEHQQMVKIHSAKKKMPNQLVDLKMHFINWIELWRHQSQMCALSVCVFVWVIDMCNRFTDSFNRLSVSPEKVLCVQCAVSNSLSIGHNRLNGCFQAWVFLLAVLSSHSN